MKRSYSVNIAGRVKNFPLPQNRPLVPLYEAVVNSLHAIEERRKADPSFSDGKIDVCVERSPQISMNEAEPHPVIGFEIIDNGIGFTEQNMQSFLESDSTYKSSIGGKGVGRFSWLKAFNSVHVSSLFEEAGNFQKRDFTFSLDAPIEDALTAVETNYFLTSVHLDTYLTEFQGEAPKLMDTIAMRVVQHCLVYFLSDTCPRITISDETDTVVLNQLFAEKVKTEDNTQNFNIENTDFSLLHVKIEDRTFPANRLYLCANSRLVDTKDLETLIVDLDGQIFDRNGFLYVGVLTSKYLDEHVDMNRLSFDIPENGMNLYNKISLETIISESCNRIKEYLKDYLSVISEDKEKRIREYVTQKSPQFRHLLKYMPERIANIKPKLSDDKLDDELHNIKRDFDKSAKKEQKELLDKLNKTDVSLDEYETLFKTQVEKISDANNAVLAEYVTHRRVIIELLERGIFRTDNNKFNKESYMHKLIYPMRGTSDDIDYESHNLWLIDEKLSYCNYISSDVPLNNDPAQVRPDVLILDNPVAVSDNPNDGTIFDTIILFELKRPMRDDYSEQDNPVVQLTTYANKIRNGEAKDKNGRPIRVNDSTKYYLYAICDVTDSLRAILDGRGYICTPDGLGFFDFNQNFNAYYEVLSYDKILNDAKKRNRVLFNKLGVE